jgi:hypothetical protein
MTDKRIFTAIVLSSLVVVGVGGYIALKMGSAPEQAAVTLQSPETRSVPNITPTTQLRKEAAVTRASSSVESPEQIELTRLRAENDRLRQQQIVTSKASAPATASKPQVTIQSFEQFLKAYVAAAQAKAKKAWSDSDAGSRTAKDAIPVDTSFDLTVIGTDVQKTDSLLFPVAGVGTFREARTPASADRNRNFMVHLRSTIVLKFGLNELGKWKLVSGTKTLDEDVRIPNVEGIGGLRKGQTEQLPQSYDEDIIAAVQR